MRNAAPDDGPSTAPVTEFVATNASGGSDTDSAAAGSRLERVRRGASARRRPAAVSRGVRVAAPTEEPYVDRVNSDEWVDRFNRVYREAAGDIDAVPWSHEKASPSLVRWLDGEGRRLAPVGSRVAVVGCGLGADAVELVDRGYEVTAFDACVEAIRWARRKNPGLEHIFRVIDVLTLPEGMRGRFDVVVEVHTLQALPPEFRSSLARGMSDLLAPGGVLVAVARGRTEAEPLDERAGPPYAFTAGELRHTLTSVGLSMVGEVDERLDDNRPPVRRLTATATARRSRG